MTSKSSSCVGADGKRLDRADRLRRREPPLDIGDWTGPSRDFLGDPLLLTSTYRRGLIAKRDRAEAATEDLPPGVPSSVRLPGGETVRVEQRPGMADQMMQELAPFLAEQGFDLEGPAPDLETVQCAIDVAMKARNAALFSPTGARRAAAARALIDFTVALADETDDAARAVLAWIEPESPGPEVPEVAAVIGVGLELMDTWLGGMPDGVPVGLAGAVLLPREWRKTARPGQEVVALGSHGRAVSSCDALIVRHGGAQVLNGVAVAVASTLRAWSTRTGEPLQDLAGRLIR